MKLTLSDMKSGKWEDWNGTLPRFDIVGIKKKTFEKPEWVHFGAGNIFRGFIVSNYQKLLESGKADTGIIAVETFDYEIIDRIYTPYDNLTMNVTALSDGRLEKEILAGVAEALKGDFSDSKNKDRLEEIFCSSSLKIVSFTITEKGYRLSNSSGQLSDTVESDLQNGPDTARHVMTILTALLHKRFLSGKLPLSLVSMDNCSHNGKKLRSAVLKISDEWEKREFVEPEFTAWLRDKSCVSFPWSMIDRITPHPAAGIGDLLKSEGWEDMDIVTTEKNTYIAPFVNAEETRYLFIEDSFPNGKIPINETEGIWFTDRETVNNVETMKVTTCLNPLHTAIAVTGSLFGYKLVSEAVTDREIDKLIYRIGYDEGLPVVTNPGIINPIDFLDQVYHKRFPNPYIPDSPQRIATDTSIKVGIRFGETIKAYIRLPGRSMDQLIGIPLAIAAWFRYLLGTDDEGQPVTVSPDPKLGELQSALNIEAPFGKPADLKDILRNVDIFGTDLWKAGIGGRIQEYYENMCSGTGAVRKTLQKYL